MSETTTDQQAGARLTEEAEGTREQTSSPAAQAPRVRNKGMRSGCLTLLGAAIAGAIAGAVIGGIVGAATEPPPDPNAFVDLRGLHTAVFAFFGGVIGVGAAVLACALWPLLRRLGRPRTGRGLVGFGVAAVAILSVGLLAGCGSGGGLKWSDKNPVWSPDGRRIAFESNRANPKRPLDAVYVMNADGSGVRRLTPVSGDAELPSWSPDGTQIAYVSNLLQSTSYAPDGVYTDAAAINTVRADGRGGTILASSGYTNGPPQWSPDGRWIAFQVGKSEVGTLALDIVRPNGAAQRRLAVDASTFAWSPDAKHLVFSQSAYTGGSTIYIVDINSRGRVPLAYFSGDVVDAVAWAPNRSKIALISGWLSTDGSATMRPHVYVVETKTGAKRAVGSLGITNTDGLAWLRRGSKRLVYYDDFGVYTSSAGGRERQISSDGCCAEPSPNGREVLTVGYGASTNNTALFVQTINGGKRQLTQTRKR